MRHGDPEPGTEDPLSFVGGVELRAGLASPTATSPRAQPARVVIGAGNYGHQLGFLDIGYTATVGFDDDDVTYGGGLELGYWPIRGRTFIARVGFQDVPDGSDASHVTTGFAFWGDNITVEWAFRPFSGADEGGTQLFGLQ